MPESPVNWITNNLLKSSRNPSELYYCQPYVKDLSVIEEAQRVLKSLNSIVTMKGE